MSKRIVGNIVGIPSPHTDFSETDPTKGSYLKNRESLIQLIKNSGGGSGGATPSIIDLGTFGVLYDEDMNEVSNTEAGFYKAMEGARQTGVYKICMQEGSVLGDGTRNITVSETYLIFVVADVVGKHEIVSQLCLSQDTYNDTTPNYVHPPVIRKYCYDEQKKKYVWVAETIESSQFKVNDINSSDINPTQCYPSVEAVSNFVNDKIVTNYGEWFENARDDTDFDKKVPAMRVIYDFFEYSNYLSERNIKQNISADDFIYTDIPNVEAVKSYVDAQMNIAPEQELPAVLQPNKEYNLGMITDAVILFPEEANDGDVIYVVFTAGTPSDNVLIAINIDFTSGLSEFEPEPGKKYEIYGKYDSRDAVWLCGYAEY